MKDAAGGLVDVDDNRIGVFFFFCSKHGMTSCLVLGAENWLMGFVMRWFGSSWEDKNVVAECLDGWDSSCVMLMI